MYDLWNNALLGFSIAGYIFALFLVPRVILERRHPSATLAWMLAIIFVPLVGVPLYYLIGVRRIRRHIRAKIAATSSIAYPLDHRISPLDLPTAVAEQCGRVLKATGTPPPVSGNRVTFLTRGDDAYDAVHTLIAGAKEHIHAEFFILDSDVVGKRFIQALAARAKEGIRVRLLLDDIGSWRALRRLMGPLRDAGGEIAAFLPALPLQRRRSAHLRNHRKLLIADGRKAFTGGMNIGKKYMGPRVTKGQWKDLSVRIEGPAVSDLQALFLDDWAYATDQAEPHGNFFPELPAFTGGNPSPCILQVATSGPDRATQPIYQGVFTAFTAARRRIWIETPYFVPDEGIMAALRNAALRNVDVRLIVPASSDLRLVSYAGRSYFNELLSVGIRIFLYRPTNLHSKVLIIDDDVAGVGSPNVDIRSFFLNFELGLFLYDYHRVEELADIFREDLSWSDEVDPEAFARRSRTQRLLEDSCRILSPVL
ncbi:MAG: cardiolipin synthase [Deltaproteobacteria bacterium]|nr:cardiolipin synthase [Deltaproteobacteria bacterium]